MYLTNLHAGWESLYEGSISYLGIHMYALILTTCFAFAFDFDHLQRVADVSRWASI